MIFQGSIKEKADKIKSFKFVRNVLTLQAGSFSGVIIQAVTGIIIARLLQPELFGVYALAFGLASITTLVIGMGIQEAVSSLLGRAYAEGNKQEIENILGFMLKITFFAAIIVLGASFFLPIIAAKLYGSSIIGVYAAIVAVAVILSSLFFTLLYSSFQVTGRVKSLAGLILSDQGFRSGLSLAMVLVGLGVAGAVGGHFVGAVAVLILSVSLFRKFKLKEPLFPGLRRLISVARNIQLKKYLSFTFWVALDRNMGNIFMALPVILTGVYVTASEVSFFKLAFGYVNIALGLLGPISILLNVRFPKVHLEDPDKLYQDFKKISFYSLGFSIILTVAAILVSPVAFRILYGDVYLPSIKYIYGLLVYGAIYGIGVGLGPMWRATKTVKVSIIINTLILAGGIPLGLWLIKNYGLWGSVVMVTIWFSVSHLVSFFYLIRKLRTA